MNSLRASDFEIAFKFWSFICIFCDFNKNVFYNLQIVLFDLVYLYESV